MELAPEILEESQLAMVLFWIIAALIGYIYIGYPVTLALVAPLMNRPVRKVPQTPSVTIIIPAHNEEKEIKKTLENKLQLDYPKDRMEILVVSDGSTDKTDEIVDELAAQGVRLLRQEPRQGKTSALNQAVAQAQGEVIVFSDANSIYRADALRHLTANFADPRVGYVTGRMIYVHPDGSMIGDGCSTYIRYENFLRGVETRIGSLVGVNGGIDAIRKSLYKPMRKDQQPDFILPLKVVENGFRVVFEPDAVLKENALAHAGDEYVMRVRVSLRALHAIWDMKHLLNPIRYRGFAYQFFSHKVMRYGAFFLFIALYLLNVLLLPQARVYALALFLQTGFYLCALSGWILERIGKGSGLFYIPFYFSLLNVASAHAVLMMLRGKRQVIWNPRGG